MDACASCRDFSLHVGGVSFVAFGVEVVWLLRPILRRDVVVLVDRLLDRFLAVRIFSTSDRYPFAW